MKLPVVNTMFCNGITAIIKNAWTIILLVLFFIFNGSNAFSQTAAEYTFSYSATGTYSEIIGTPCTSAQGDDYYQTAIPMGFNFNYCGSIYSTFNVTSNGNLYFGSSSNSNDIASTTYKTIIAPLWDDLYSGSIQYALSGTSPNRVLTVQWELSKWNYGGTAGQNFQVKLFETTNIIQFVYGMMVAPNSPSASIGISDATGGSGHFISVTPGITPTSSSAAANNTINAITYLTNGLIYQFAPPTCFVPNNVNSSSVTSTTATIFWAAVSPAPGNGYQYEVRSSGAAGSGSIGLAANGATSAGVVSANITGLSAATTYYVYVRSYCGGTDYSSWTSSYSFTTACGSITSFPYIQSFSSTVPSCWFPSEGVAGATYHWAPTTTDATHGPSAPVSGSHFMFLNVFNASTSKNPYYLTTVNFDLGAIPRQLKYYYFLGANGYSTTPVPLEVEITTNGGSSWTSLFQHTSGNSTMSAWTLKTIDLSSYAGQTISIRFKSNSNYGSNLCDQGLDEFIIESLPTCFSPGTPSSSSVTATTASISWTAASPLPSNGYEYEVRTSGAAGSGPTGLAVSGSTLAGVVSANILGLLPVTTYYVYVRSFCGGIDYSVWTNSCSFTTACGSISGLPWSQNFDGMGSIGNSVIPSCWKIESGSGTPWNSGNAGSITYNDPSSSPNYIYCNYLPTLTDKYLITPGFNLTAGISYDFKFKYAGDGYSGWTGNVRYNTAQTGSGSIFYGNFLSSTTTTSSSYTEVTNTFVPSSTATYYFIIHVNNSSSPYYLGFDDFSLLLSPTTYVQVNATAGPGNSVGYPTLKTAFDAINAGTHQGDVTVTVGNASNQIITETIQAKLNKSGTGASSYTSVIVRPGASNIMLTSTLGASLATVYLYEVQNVVFDGRIGSAGSTVDLSIENTSAAASYGTVFMYGAQNNILKYCTLKSSSSSNVGYGTVSLLASGSYGCSNNSIENCFITKSGATMPQIAVVSRSLSSSYKNTGNAIKNCTISDFQRVGIWLGSYSGTSGNNDLWTIDNNSFYQSSSINLSLSNNNGTSTYDNYAILVGHTTSGSLSPAYNEYGSFVIKNNTIGGNGAGGKWSATGSSTSNKIIPIYVAGSNASYSEVYGNTISNFEVETQYFYGICAYYSKVKIGSNGANTISNIILMHPAATGGSFGGVYVSTNSDYTTEIMNCSIANMSTTTGNIYTNFYGVYNYSSTTHPKDIVNNNIVKNIDASKAGVAYGFYVQGYIAQNHVSKIKFSGTNPLYGIWWGGGKAAGLDYRVENNEVILGLDDSGTSTAANSDVYGIFSNRSEITLFYNSVLLQGIATTKNSYCLRLNSNATGYVVKNNLFYNERNGGTGSHYCISTAFSTTSYWASSNNAYILYSGSKASYYLGDWNGTAKATLANWALATGETNSISENSSNKPIGTFFPTLAISDNLLPANDNWLCAGVVVTPATDFVNTLRHDPAPTTIGAYERDCLTILPIDLLWFEGSNTGDGKIKLSWATASEMNNDYFTIEKSMDAISFEPAIVQKGAGNSNSIMNYNVFDPFPLPGINYYRLRQTDFDGTSSFTRTISVDYGKDNLEIYVYPNPFTDHFFINTGSGNANDTKVQLLDITGKSINLKKTIMEGNIIEMTIDEDISDGIFVGIVQTEKECKYFKIMKYSGQ